MLYMKIEGGDYWNEAEQEFIPVKSQLLQLEHSLVSISKWEAKWKKPFLSTEDKTKEETLDYIRYMTITQNVNPKLYSFITNKQILAVNDYIADPMTATTFRKEEGKGFVYNTLTSEDIYYYMVAYQIPFEFQKWHFNRLMALIRVCDEKNKPKKGMRKAEYAAWRSKINAARRAKFKSRG